MEFLEMTYVAIPVLVPILCKYLKKVLPVKWTPYVAAALGVLFVYGTKHFTGAELSAFRTLLDGLCLGLCGVGVYEVSKNPLKFILPGKSESSGDPE